MGIFNNLKRVGGNILSGARNLGGSILTGIDNIRDSIRSVTRKARNIPLVDKLLKTKIPVLNQSLDDLGNIADDAIGVAKTAGRAVGIKSGRERLEEPD